MLFCNRKVNFDHFCYGYCSACMFQSASFVFINTKSCSKIWLCLRNRGRLVREPAIRRFHDLRSFHQRLFTFAPFGDGRMSLAKVLLIILLFGNTGSYNQPSEADYTTREYLPAAHRMGELGVRTIQRRIQNTPRGPAKEPCPEQHAAYYVDFCINMSKNTALSVEKAMQR